MGVPPNDWHEDTMQTQLPDEVGCAVAWLACHNQQLGLPDRIPVAALPFTVGRSESTDLRIHSNWVSREHAVIEQDGGQVRVRDLGSTNGTYVNGHAVHEAVLRNGDVLRIGDIDFIFCADDDASGPGTVTQVMGSPSRDLKSSSISDLVARLRRSQEIALYQAFHTRLRTIYDLHTQQVCAYHFSVSPAQFEFPQAGWHSVPLECSSHSIERVRLLARLAAMDQSGQQPAAESFFLRIDASELEHWDRLASSLSIVGSGGWGGGKLILELPASGPMEPAWRKKARSTVDELGASLAIGSFRGTSAQLREQVDLKPAYVTLQKGMTRATSDSAESRLKSVLALCEGIDAKVIVDGNGNDTDRARWHDLGIRLQLNDGESV
jgi:hypothetical protein